MCVCIEWRGGKEGGHHQTPLTPHVAHHVPHGCVGLGGETIIYDPTAERAAEWAPHWNDFDVLAKVVQKLPRATVRTKTWDILLMANPLPHEVTGPQLGDRLVLVGFIGFEGRRL